MQDEKEKYKDRSRLRHILFMVLTGICSGVAVIITAPLVDGGEFSLYKAFAGLHKAAGTGTSQGGGGENSQSDDGIFGSEWSENQVAQSSAGNSSRKYTAPSNPGNSNAGYSEGYFPIENINAGRNTIATNQTAGQLQQTQGNSGVVGNNQGAQQAGSNNNTLLAGRQSPGNAAIVAEGVSKVSKAVGSAVSSARGVNSSNPPALPPDGGDPVDVPFDGAMLVLLFTGVAYGIMKAIKLV